LFVVTTSPVAGLIERLVAPALKLIASWSIAPLRTTCTQRPLESVYAPVTDDASWSGAISHESPSEPVVRRKVVPQSGDVIATPALSPPVIEPSSAWKTVLPASGSNVAVVFRLPVLMIVVPACVLWTASWSAPVPRFRVSSEKLV
jgi:hypothetical protein